VGEEVEPHSDRRSYPFVAFAMKQIVGAEAKVEDVARLHAVQIVVVISFARKRTVAPLRA
jgi:hypothetical protein